MEHLRRRPEHEPFREYRPGVVGDVTDGPEIMHRSHDVGAEGETDQPGPVADQRFEILDSQLASLRIDPPLLDHRAELRQPPPAADIGLMILVGNDNLVTGFEQGPDRLGQDVEIHCRRRAQRQLVQVAVQHAGHGLVTGFHGFTGLDGSLEGAVGLNLGILEKPCRRSLTWRGT